MIPVCVFFRSAIFRFQRRVWHVAWDHLSVILVVTDAFGRKKKEVTAKERASGLSSDVTKTASGSSSNERAALMSGIPLHVTPNSLLSMLNDKGTIEQIKYADRYKMASYNRSCIIRMKTENDLAEFLRNGPYMVDGLKLEVEEFKGHEYHKDTLKGIYKLYISEMKVAKEEEMHKDIQDLFQDFGCTDIDIHKKNGKNGFTPDGTVKLRFKTEAGRARAVL